MPSPTIANQDRAILRDCTVLQLANLPTSGGGAGTPVNYLGVVETADLSIKREFADTTGSADTGTSSRAVRFGKGTAKITGFSAGTYSLFATLFAQGSHAILSFTEKASGDAYQVVCSCEDFDATMGKDANKHTISLGIEGVPYLNGTAMVLEG
jgi:hypothetical protein